MSKWQPIETVPKDSRWVFLHCPGLEEPAVFVAQWITYADEKGVEHGEWSEYHEYHFEADPTEWAPLPGDDA